MKINTKIKLLLIGSVNCLSDSGNSYADYNNIEEKKSSNTLYYGIGIGAIGLAGLSIWALSDKDDKKDKKKAKQKKDIADLEEKIDNEQDISKKDKLIQEKHQIQLESDKDDIIYFLGNDMLDLINLVEKAMKKIDTTDKDFLNYKTKYNFVKQEIISTLNNMISKKVPQDEFPYDKNKINTTIDEVNDIIIDENEIQKTINDIKESINNNLNEKDKTKIKTFINENQNQIHKIIDSFVEIIPKCNNVLSHVNLHKINTDKIEKIKNILLTFIKSLKSLI
jgi:hypothetical protein